MDRFLIAPVGTGLQKDLPAFIIPEDAYQRMENAYVFRGRVKKRFGSRYTGSPAVPNNSRLRINLGPTVAGALSGTVPGTIFQVGQQFSIGSVIYTVITPGAAQAMLKTGATTTATYSTTNGAYNFVGAPAGDVFFYPSSAVMGLGVYETGPVNNQPAVAFDLENPYQYNGTSWEYLEGAMETPVFTGTITDLFWTTTWRGITDDSAVLFVSNFVDPIWYWDGSDWNQFNPDATTPINTEFNANGDFVFTARIILPFQGHLVVLNTIEKDGMSGVTTSYINRARFSAYGNPFTDGAWLIPEESFSGTNAFGGNFVDAATQEAIVGAEFIKDRLIVYFEASTWELAYTGNNVLPFTWQKINTELGAVGTFSTVPFDRAVLGIGKTGVHACSGANVERIDQKIPDDIFTFRVKGNALQQIWGIRVYQPEFVVWTFLDNDAPSTSSFPNKQMIYNYENQTWSFNDDCVTSFGYFEQQSDLTWQNATFTWESTNAAWNSYIVPAQQRQVIFGNQQGFVSILVPDEDRNIGNMQITNMTNVGDTWTFTVINHNLNSGDFILLENYNGITPTNPIVQVNSIVNANTFIVVDLITGTYTGGGTIARVSRIDIISKQWNPYLKNGYGIYLAKILFGVITTVAGSIQVDYNSDDSNEDFVFDSGPAGTNSIMGTNALDTYPYTGFDTEGAARVWHPVYFQGQGNCVQVHIYLNDLQMLDINSSLARFELEGLILHTQRGTMQFS